MPKLSVVPLSNQAWDAAQTTVGSNSVTAIEEAIDAKNAVQEFIAEFNGGKYKLRKNRDELKKIAASLKDSSRCSKISFQMRMPRSRNCTPSVNKLTAVLPQPSVSQKIFDK